MSMEESRHIVFIYKSNTLQMTIKIQNRFGSNCPLAPSHSGYAYSPYPDLRFDLNLIRTFIFLT